MIVVKKLSSLNSRAFFFDREQLDCGAWCEYQSTRVIYPEYYQGDIFSNKVYYLAGIVENDYIEFVLGDYKLILDMDTPENLIHYVKCFYIAPIIKIEKSTEERYEITTQGMIRLIFNGPAELALVWRLSI